MNRFKVSIDFDETLQRRDVSNFVQVLIISNVVDVWITTSRYDDIKAQEVYLGTKDNSDLWHVVKKLNISKNKVYFTNMKNKFYYISKNNFLFHLDDNFEELDLINRYTLCKGISCKGSGNWMTKCMKMILDKY